jgi:dienelactone hydrolase
MSKQTQVPLEFEGDQLEGVLVGRRDNAPRPTVIMFPTVVGVSDLELGFARQLVELGFNGFVADLYGKQFRGAERPVMRGQMDRLLADRAALRRRLLAVLGQVRGLGGVEPDSIAAAGYCFGGLCALDLARSGARVAGVASFHGLFNAPDLPPQPITAKIAAFHGWEDPLVPPDQVLALAKELTAAGADWQIHAYGNVRHGFTNPGADALGVEAVRYNALAAERSWTSLINFLEELFG